MKKVKNLKLIALFIVYSFILTVMPVNFIHNIVKADGNNYGINYDANYDGLRLINCDRTYTSLARQYKDTTYKVTKEEVFKNNDDYENGNDNNYDNNYGYNNYADVYYTFSTYKNGVTTDNYRVKADGKEIGRNLEYVGSCNNKNYYSTMIKNSDGSNYPVTSVFSIDMQSGVRTQELLINRHVYGIDIKVDEQGVIWGLYQIGETMDKAESVLFNSKGFEYKTKIATEGRLETLLVQGNKAFVEFNKMNTNSTSLLSVQDGKITKIDMPNYIDGMKMDKKGNIFGLSGAYTSYGENLVKLSIKDGKYVQDQIICSSNYRTTFELDSNDDLWTFNNRIVSKLQDGKLVAKYRTSGWGIYLLSVYDENNLAVYGEGGFGSLPQQDLRKDSDIKFINYNTTYTALAKQYKGKSFKVTKEQNKDNQDDEDFVFSKVQNGKTTEQLRNKIDGIKTGANIMFHGSYDNKLYYSNFDFYQRENQDNWGWKSFSLDMNKNASKDEKNMYGSSKIDSNGVIWYRDAHCDNSGKILSSYLANSNGFKQEFDLKKGVAEDFNINGDNIVLELRNERMGPNAGELAVFKGNKLVSEAKIDNGFWKFKINKNGDVFAVANRNYTNEVVKLKIKDNKYVVDKSFSIGDNEPDGQHYFNSWQKEYDFDNDGNLWILSSGIVYKLEDGNLVAKYKTSPELNLLSVYDDNNITVYGTEGCATLSQEVIPAIDLTPAAIPMTDIQPAPVVPMTGLEPAPVVPMTGLQPAPVVPMTGLEPAPVVPMTGLEPAPVVPMAGLTPAAIPMTGLTPAAKIVTAAVATDNQGVTTAKVDNTKVDKDAVSVVEVKPSADTKVVEARIDAATIKGGKGSLNVSTGTEVISVPYSAVDLTNAPVGATVSIKQVVLSNDATLKDTKGVSKVFEFDMAVLDKDGNKISDVHNFKSGVATATIQLNDSDLQGLNQDNLAVFYYNETTKAWDNMGGTFDKVTKQVVFATPHFSKFAVLEVKSATPTPSVVTPTTGNKGTITSTTTTTTGAVTPAAAASSVATTAVTATSLPKTGSPLDMDMLLMLGTIATVAGAFLVMRKKM